MHGAPGAGCQALKHCPGKGEFPWELRDSHARLPLRRVPNPIHTPASGGAAPCNGSHTNAAKAFHPRSRWERQGAKEARGLEHRGRGGERIWGLKKGTQELPRRPGPTPHSHLLLPRAHTPRVVTKQMTPKELPVRPSQGLSQGARFPDRTCAQPIRCEKQDFRQE